MSIQDQTQLVFLNRSVEGAKQEGYPTFNNCNHYIVDMSHLDPKTKDWMNTISIKLPNGNFATLCIMQTSKDETCIDAKFHGANLKDHRVSEFGDIYALIAHSNEDLS